MLNGKDKQKYFFFDFQILFKQKRHTEIFFLFSKFIQTEKTHRGILQRRGKGERLTSCQQGPFGSWHHRWRWDHDHDQSRRPDERPSGQVVVAQPGERQQRAPQQPEGQRCFRWASCHAPQQAQPQQQQPDDGSC
jgi:hypothetical protein